MPHQTSQSCLKELVQTADRILLMQGPVGVFFQDLSNWLTQHHGKTVFKLNFNYGDETFYPLTHKNTFAYRGTYTDFNAYLQKFIQTHNIQAIMCFGDTRPYHLVAKQLVSQINGVSFWAFEEGYFRPHFVTLEKNGVNAYSTLPRTAEFFLNAYEHLPQHEYEAPPPVPAGFKPVAKLATQYYVANHRHSDQYPNYVHHRDSRLKHYVHLWLSSGMKRVSYYLKDYNFARQVKNGHYGQFFILPLQVFNDSQIRVHSDFNSVRDFLLHVLYSFAASAPEYLNLIVKHHPMDRGFIDYQKDIDHFIHFHPEFKKRIFYIHDVPLPALLRYGKGMVTLNSTSGLSALIHHMPVKVLGRVHYDIPGMTFQGSLADFWHNPSPPDAELFHAYRMYHINNTQINGSFYSRVNFPKW